MRDTDTMSHYVRPVIDAGVFEDEQGRVIDYGNRWGDDGPPEDTYSVDPHPQRFAPIHTIGEALIAHLSETYDVSVTDGTAALAVTSFVKRRGSSDAVWRVR